MAHKYKIYKIKSVLELEYIGVTHSKISNIQKAYESTHGVVAWVRQVCHKTQSNYWVGMDNDGKLIIKVCQE